jgi:hypothetical protein
VLSWTFGRAEVHRIAICQRLRSGQGSDVIW